MKELISQLNLMIEEIDTIGNTEHMRGYLEGLRVSVHMMELFNKLQGEQKEGRGGSPVGSSAST